MNKELDYFELCDDIIGVVYSFLDYRDAFRVSIVNEQFNNCFRNGLFWKEYFLKLFSPTFLPIPEEYKGKLTNDFFRICYLSVVKGSSWKFDKTSVVGDDLISVCNQVECLMNSSLKVLNIENIANKVYTSEFYEENTVAMTFPKCMGKNVSVSTMSRYMPREILKEGEPSGCIHFEILEIEPLVINGGNYSIGVVNEYFTYDQSFAGYGKPIVEKNSDFFGKVSYGYASSGEIRKNYCDGDAGSKHSESYTIKDRITMVWQKPDHSVRDFTTNKSEKYRGKFSAEIGNGHNFFWFKNGKLMQPCVREDFEIRVKMLRPTVTLYNQNIGDCNAVRIVTNSFAIDFWEVVFPLIVKDVGIEKLIH